MDKKFLCIFERLQHRNLLYVCSQHFLCLYCLMVKTKCFILAKKDVNWKSVSQYLYTIHVLYTSIQQHANEIYVYRTDRLLDRKKLCGKYTIEIIKSVVNRNVAMHLIYILYRTSEDFEPKWFYKFHWIYGQTGHKLTNKIKK